MPLKPFERPRQAFILTDFSGGINRDAAYPMIPQDQSIIFKGEYYNRSIRKSGGAQVIATPLSAGKACMGLFQFRKHETDGTITRQLLVLYGGAIYELTGSYPTYTFTNRGLLSGLAYATAAQLGNRMVISNGIGDPQVWDGSSMQDAEVPDPDPIAAPIQDANTGGALTVDGDYRLAYIFYSSTATDKSNPSDVVTHAFTKATPAGADSITGVIDPQTVPARFDKIRLYRSRVDISTLQFEKEESFTPAAGGTATWGTKTDDLLGVPLEYNNDPMPLYQIIWPWDGRLFGLGHKENQTELAWSKRDQPTIWDLEDSIELDSNDGFPLTGMRSIPGRLAAFKRNKAYLITQDPFSTYGSRQVPSNLGLLTHWGAALANNALWGVGEGSFWRFDGAFFQNISQSRYGTELNTIKGASNADPIWVVADTAGDRNRLLVGLREVGELDGTGLGGTIDMDTQGYFRDDNLARALAVVERDDGSAWILGGKDSNVLELLEDSADVVIGQFDGADIEQEWRSGSIDPEPQVAYKMFTDLVFLLRQPRGTVVAGDTYKWTVRYDDSSTITHEYGTFGPFPGGITWDVVEFPVRLSGRFATRIQIGLENDNANKKEFVLVGVRVGWKAMGEMYSY